MAKTFQCRHGGVVCGAKVSGETEDEVLEKAIAHAREKHGVDISESNGVDISESTTLTRYARSLIRDQSPAARTEGQR